MVPGGLTENPERHERQPNDSGPTGVKCYRNLILFELPCSLGVLHTRCRPSERENMDLEKLLTKEKADAICEKIAKGLEENKIVGSANMISYAMKESWFAGFEEGRKYPLKEST